MIGTDATLEELLERYLEARRDQEKIDASVKELGAAMLQMLDRESVQEKTVSNHRILKIVRTDFKTTLEQARELKATEMVEQVNKDTLKRLHQQGVVIPGANVSSHVRIYEPKSAG